MLLTGISQRWILLETHVSFSDGVWGYGTHTHLHIYTEHLLHRNSLEDQMWHAHTHTHTQIQRGMGFVCKGAAAQIVLQCVAVCCNVLQCVAVCCNVLQRGAVCRSVLQCIAACCSVLQCVAVHGSV